MDIKKANTNFSVEQLLNGKLNKEQFKVDFTPMWHYLDNLERKIGGFDKVTMKEILESVYEFAIISVSLDKADMTTRIDNLNEQNLKWFQKADNLELELNNLKAAYEELRKTTDQGVSVSEETPFEIAANSQ